MKKIINKYLIIIQILSSLFLLTNCTSFNKNEKPSQLSDKAIYSEGLASLKKGNYKQAILEFDKVYFNYPFSSLASKSEIMTAYSLYENNELKKAITKLNNFIEMNPKGELTQYAHYLLAMCYYTQTPSQDRDPSLSIKALNYFKLIISKYPNSKYAKDSKLKIKYLKNTLAKNELNIGKFYLSTGAPASSIRRFKFILNNYQNSSVIPETLFRLSEALLIIGLKEEAIKSNAILSYNFPNNKWAKLSKELFDNKLDTNKSEYSKLSISNFFKNFFE